MGHERHHEHEHDHHHEHDHEPPRGGRDARGPLGRHRDHGGWGGGRRMRRGDIRRAILSVLRDDPAHGYEVMRRLEQMSGGVWRPSPGSVYPHLQMLEDEGLVRSAESGGTRTFQMTEEGMAEATQSFRLPWESGDESDDQIRNLRNSVTQLMGAAKQLSSAGVNEQVERGIAVIQKARKELYQILAED